MEILTKLKKFKSEIMNLRKKKNKDNILIVASKAPVVDSLLPLQSLVSHLGPCFSLHCP